MINEERLLDEFLELFKLILKQNMKQKLRKFLKEKFTALGLDVFEDDTTAVTGHGAGNLICTLAATKEGVDHHLFHFSYGYCCSGNGS